MEGITSFFFVPPWLLAAAAEAVQAALAGLIAAEAAAQCEQAAKELDV